MARGQGVRETPRAPHRALRGSREWRRPCRALRASCSSLQVIIICLVVLDALLVLAELLLDLKIIEPDEQDYAVTVRTGHAHT